MAIIELTAEGYSRRGIQQKLGISKSTVQRVIQEWKSSSQLQPASRSGRPPALNSRDKRRLYRLSDANTYASLRDLAAESGFGVCSETVAWALRASGRYVRWARHKPYINEGNRLKRVKWARSQRRTTVEEWQKRIFTDEIHVELSARRELYAKIIHVMETKIYTIRCTTSFVDHQTQNMMKDFLHLL